jgi:hypothetical protein
MRRQVHLAAADFSRAIDEVPGVQEAGSEGVFDV